MKWIPEAISRKVARQVLLAKKNSPTILFGAGVVGMVGSTVLACRATLQLEDVLDEVENQLARQKEARRIAETHEAVSYLAEEYRRDSVIIYSRAVTKVGRLYLPSIALGAASIFALTKSHNILQDRNAQITAAYVAIDEAFKRYRQRVVEKYGEDEDRDLRYGAESVDIIDDETGQIISSIRAGEDQEHSLYARWFDEESECWTKHPEYNILFLRHQQNYWNDVLKSRGHVFLNEVYRDLGLPHTKAGAVVGWIRRDGDGFIDFGCWDGDEQALDFFNGRENAVLLDFNVDGVIYDKLDERSVAQQWRDYNGE